MWDAKAHTVVERLEPSGREVQRGTDSAILNDVGAITDCLSEQGLGFLILDGGATFDETGRFDSWHRAYSREGRASVSYRPNSEHKRRRKAAFVPLALRAIWIPDIAALDAGISGGWMTVARQGSQQARSGQAHGAGRGDKFQLKVHRSAAWTVALASWD